MTRFSGAIGGAPLSALKRHAILPHRKLPDIVTALGDSRIAAIWADNVNGLRRNRSANSPLNMANALIGHRMVIGETYGLSGDRSDQVLARLPLALGHNAGLLYIQCGLNDIAQNYPTALSSGTTAFANIYAMTEAARIAGMIVVIELEVGSNTISASQVAQIVELNARLYEYAESTPNIHLHDARAVILNQAYSSTLVNYRSGYTYDGVHANARGALYWGESLAELLSPLIPQRPGLLSVNRYELVGVGRRQMLANANFTTASGGTLTGGMTGAAPGNWSTGKSPSTIASMSVAAKSGGFGNEVTMDATFTTAGEQCRIYQDVANVGDWNAGEAFEVFAKVRINGTPTALGRIQLYGQCNTAPSGTHDFTDGTQDDSWLGPDHSATLTLLTRPLRSLP